MGHHSGFHSASRSFVHRFILVVASTVVIFSGAGRAPAASLVPKLSALSTEWIQRGTTLEITVTGENLSEVTRIVFDGDVGLSATNVVAAAPMVVPTVQVESAGGSVTRAAAKPASNDSKRLVLRVTAAANATLTPRELRIMTPGGVSNPLNLNVGQWPEVRKPEGLTGPTAPLVELPAVISGTISAMGQTNQYRFKAAKGDDLVFDVEAARRGSALDSSLLILDLQGKELARNEDADGLDSRLFFKVPADGEYLVSIRDFRFRGGGDYFYRLTAGLIPYVESVFPFGARRGRSVDVSVKGHNLDGVTNLSLEVAAMAPRSQEIRLTTPRGLSNPILFSASDLTEVAEAEPNDTVEKAQMVTIPLVVNGRVGQAGDIDRYRFKSAQDQKLTVDVAASRFGSHLDALLILTDTNGTVLAQNDDAAGPDARLEVDAKKDTDYIVGVRDLTDRGGRDFGYRLSIRPPTAAAAPSFSVKYLPDVPVLHRGGSVRLRCEVARAGGFEGPVRFTAESLPAGVYAESLVIPNVPHSGLLLLHAQPDAPLGTVPLRVMASGVIAGKTVTVPAEALAGDRAVRQGYLTILEAVPFTLDVTTLGLGLEQNQGGTIEVFAERRDGFAGEIKLSAEGFNAGREGLGKSFSGGNGVIKAGESIGRIAVTPKMDSEVGIRTVVVRGEASVDGGTVATYAEPIPISVTQYPLVLSSTLPRLALALLPPGSTSAAGDAETKIRVDRRGGFNGDIELSLEGLPEGVRSELPRIPAGVGEVTLQLHATDKAKLGTNYNLSVVGKAVFNDKNYLTRTAPIGLTINLPESVEVATNAAPVRAESSTK